MEKPLEAYGAHDPEKEAVSFELLGRLRSRYIDENTGGNLPKTAFVMSLASGRYDDCRKDIRRGRISKELAQHLIKEAIRHKLFQGWWATQVVENIIGENPKGE